LNAIDIVKRYDEFELTNHINCKILYCITAGVKLAAIGDRSYISFTDTNEGTINQHANHGSGQTRTRTWLISLHLFHWTAVPVLPICQYAVMFGGIANTSILIQTQLRECIYRETKSPILILLH